MELVMYGWQRLNKIEVTGAQPVFGWMIFAGFFGRFAVKKTGNIKFILTFAA